MQQQTREIVVPGDVLDDTGRLRPGANTIKEGGKIYAARLGVKSVRGDSVHVVSLSGRYDPQRGDMVIGTVVETGPSNWYINVGASGDVGMHVNDVPWRVEFGETAKYLNTGDTVLLKVFHVDELKKVQVTMKDRQARKLTGGIVVEVSPSKVPRIVGRNGSMVALIKNMTSTRMFVGQNGVIWIDGEPKDVALAIRAIRLVEEQAHTTGLTDKVRAFLEENGGVWREGASEGEDDGGFTTPAADKPRGREWRADSGWEQPAADEGGRPPRRPREDRHGRGFDERRGGGRGGGRGGDRRGGFGRDRGERREGGFGRERREGGERREDRPRRFEERVPRAEGEERPRFGEREERPRRFGERDEERPRRVDDREERPRRFGDERPRREDRPRRFEDERPRREGGDRPRRDEERPRRFGERDERPRGSDVPRPGRRDEPQDRPEDRPRRFGAEDERPEGPRRFGASDADEPARTEGRPRRFGAPEGEADRPEGRTRRFGAPDEDDRPAPKPPSRRFGAEGDEPADDLSASSGRFGGDESGERREGGGRRRRRGGRGRRRGGGREE